MALTVTELEAVAGGAIPIITGGPVLGARVPRDEEGPVLGSGDPAKIPVKTV